MAMPMASMAAITGVEGGAAAVIMHLLVKGLTLRLAGAGNHRRDDRCAAEMGDTGSAKAE